MKKGDVAIWHSNLLHGGAQVVDESRTRHSLAVHYFLDSASIGWAPMFSDPDNLDFHFKSTMWFDRNGNYRNLRESKNEVMLF
jgi:hypothetical protein